MSHGFLNELTAAGVFLLLLFFFAIPGFFLIGLFPAAVDLHVRGERFTSGTGLVWE